MTTIPPEAIEAAARALCSLGADEHGFTYCETHGVEIHVAGIRTCDVGREEADAALTAALPHIEAAIRADERERIATGLSYLRELAHGNRVLLAAIDAIARGADR